MKSSQELLGSAILRLEGGDFSEALIDWMAAAIPHDNIALLAYFQDRNPSLLFARSETPEVHANLDDSYVNGAYLLDPFHKLHLNQSPSGVYRLIDIAPDQFSKNQYFIEYYAKTTMVDEIAFVSYPSRGVSLHLCLGRDRESSKKYTQGQLRDAKSIAPVVSSLLNRQWSNLETSGSFDERQAIHRLIELAQSTYEVNLTDRQGEVIFLILKGHSSGSISLQMNIAYQTVKVFRRQIYKKCQISSQAELFSMFVPLLGK
ncbi:MAG: helix-turn-helix transcriptional regulator [Rhodobacteraceae bacterium]|nr:helix-turn-helix transcriptional regulator [Paracoccaceae bacterium]